MGKNKFTKRKEKRRAIRGEMVKRGILAKDIAAQLGITEAAVSQGYGVPRIMAALIQAGLPARLFKAKAAGGDACATNPTETPACQTTI